MRLLTLPLLAVLLASMTQPAGAQSNLTILIHADRVEIIEGSSAYNVILTFSLLDSNGNPIKDADEGMPAKAIAKEAKEQDEQQVDEHGDVLEVGIHPDGDISLPGSHETEGADETVGEQGGMEDETGSKQTKEGDDEADARGGEGFAGVDGVLHGMSYQAGITEDNTKIRPGKGWKGRRSDRV